MRPAPLARRDAVRCVEIPPIITAADELLITATSTSAGRRWARLTVDEDVAPEERHHVAVTLTDRKLLCTATIPMYF